MTYNQIIAYLNLLGIRSYMRRGSFVVAPCPFAKIKHENGTDNNPSFGIKIGNSFYNCFTCGESGPIYELHHKLLYYKQEVNKEAIDKFFENIINLFLTIEEEDTSFPYEIFNNAKTYSSMYPRATDQDHNVFTAEEKDLYDLRYNKENNTLLFPYYGKDDSLLYGVFAIYLDENGFTRKRKFISDLTYSPNKRGIFFGEHLVSYDQPVLLVEGQKDAIYAHRYYKNVISAPVNLTDEHLKKLVLFSRGLILFYDNDKAGWAAKDFLKRKLGTILPISEVTEYFGYKDAEDIVKAGYFENVFRSIKSIYHTEVF